MARALLYYIIATFPVSALSTLQSLIEVFSLTQPQLFAHNLYQLQVTLIGMTIQQRRFVLAELFLPMHIVHEDIVFWPLLI